MRYYVVADVHSFYSELQKALTEKGYFDDKEPHKLIVCGDLFDRGDESVEVQRFITELIEKDEVILIRGNHEDLILELMENAEYYFGREIVYSHHWSNGTVKTVADLTGMDVFSDDYKDIVAKMNDTPYIKEIIPKTIDYFETEHYIFVHGWIPCLGVKNYWGENYLPIEKWREVGEEKWREARWTNGMLAHSQGVKEEGKTIVCGHFHCSWGWSHLRQTRKEFPQKSRIDWQKSFEPYMDDGIIAIDGCTAYSGIVNCLVIED